MAARLTHEEGIPSTGANVVATLRVAERTGEGTRIVTVMCGTGMKHLNKR